MKYAGLIRNGLKPVASKDCEFEAVDYAVLIIVGVGNFVSEPMIDKLRKVVSIHCAVSVKIAVKTEEPVRKKVDAAGSCT